MIHPLRPALRPLGLALAAWLAGGAAGAAECVAPKPPDVALRPVKPTPPVKGPCVDAQPGTAGCKGWEMYSFNDEVRAYNAKLPAYKEAAEGYVAKLNSFVQASGAYARCEVDGLR